VILYLIFMLYACCMLHVALYADLKLDALVELKSNETTGNLCKDVRKSIRHRDLAGNRHHNRNSGIEVSTGYVASEHNGNS